MSKPSLATAQKPSATPLTTKSAWSKGPPVASPVSGPTQSSRGQSPNGTPGSTPSHSRKSSTFTPAVAVKDGVSIPRGVAPSHRASPSLNFGSIDANASSPTPANAAPAVAAAPPVNGSSSTPPPTNPTPAKTFGSIPASSSPLASTVSSSTAPTASASPTPSNTSTTATSSAPAPARRKLDPHKMFQVQPTQPSPAPSSSASPVNPPSTASALPPQTYPNANAPVNSPQQRLQSLPPPATHQPYYSPQQQNQQIPAQHLRPQNGAGAGGPRSPSFSRHMQLSGSSQGPNGLPANGVQVPGRGPPGGPQQQPTQMGSPRLTGQAQMMPHPQPPQQGQPPPPGPPPGQMPGQPPYPPQQMAAPGWQQPAYGWPQYQQYPPYMVPQDQWYPPHMQHPHMQHPHHHPAQSQYLQTPTTPHQAFPQPLPAQNTGQPPQQLPPAPSPRVPVNALPHQTTGSSIAPPPPVVNTNVPTPPPGQGSALRTPLTAAAREFIPSSAGSPVQPTIGFPLPPKRGIKITNPSGDPVVLRPPDGTHNRTLSREVLDPAKKGVPVRMESEEDKKKRIAEEEAKVRKAKEEAEAKEAEKKRKEEEERRKKEEEELEAKRKVEEAERLKREEEERVKREEEERVRKEAEERKRKEDKERRQKEEAERLKREEEERVQKEKEAVERRAQEEAEAKVKAEKEAEEARARAAKEEAETKEREEKDKVSALARTPSSTSISASPKFTPPLLPSKPHLPPITTTGRPSRPVPGPLDLSSTHKGALTPSLPSALATARKIDDLGSVSYPEGIKTPDVELNEGQMKGGKYKYDRDFLLQFMAVCKDKPDGLPPLQDIGIERDQDGAPASFGRNSRRNTGSMGPPQGGRSASGVGLGFQQFPTKSNNPFAAGMGSFSTTGKMTSEDRFRAASTSIIGARGGTPMSRSTSQGGVGGIGGGNANAVPPSPREANRTRSQRGRQRNESLKPNVQQQSQMPGGPGSMLGLEPVAPLQATENRWAPTSLGRKAAVNEDSPEYVERKVKALLNKLTLEKFDSISDQIIAYANKSEKETNGATLILVIKLVFEKATDEATFSEMYARLCRKMMETISPNVQDEAIRNSENKPIIGGHLFRKYLLNRCQEDFERGWSAKESAAAAAALKAADDKAAEAAAATAADGEVAQFSDEYYAALKAKRQGLGLVRFIGELFKLQMLTERIMHECIKKLLSKIDNPEEEEIESLCKLLTTVGQSLDTPKAKNHMDIYFQRMDTLSKNQGVASRVRYMLLDVIELRARNWQARQATAAPQTIAQIHEQAAKEKNDASRLVAMSRGGSQRGAYSRGGDHNQAGPDGWNVAGPTPVRAPAKAGDLSHFGKFTAKAGGSMMMSMGPSSVFKKGDRGRETPPPNAVSRTASSSNMFSMLAGGGEAPAEPIPTVRTTSQRGSTRKPSVDTTNLQQGADTVPGTPQRKKLQLLPRSVAPAAEEKEPEENRSEADAAAAAPSMSDDQATAKVEEDVKEFFGIRDLEEGAASFDALPEQHKSKLVDKLISRAMDGKESDVKLVADLFARVAGKACPPAAFEASFGSVIEYLDDMAIDIPQAYPFMARLLRGSKLPQETVEALAAKIAVEGSPLVTPKDKLMKAYANLA